MGKKTKNKKRSTGVKPPKSTDERKNESTTKGTGFPKPQAIKEPELFTNIKKAIMKGQSANALRMLEAAKANQKLAEILDFQNAQGLTLLMLACTPRREKSSRITLPLYDVITFLVKNNANAWLRSNAKREDRQGKTAANYFMEYSYDFFGDDVLYRSHFGDQSELQRYMISESQKHLPEAREIATAGQCFSIEFDKNGNETVTSLNTLSSGVKSLAELNERLAALPDGAEYSIIELASWEFYETYIIGKRPALEPCYTNFCNMLGHLKELFTGVEDTRVSTLSREDGRGPLEDGNKAISLKITLDFPKEATSLRKQVKDWLQEHEQDQVSSEGDRLTIMDVKVAAFNDKAKEEFIALLEDEKQTLADVERMQSGQARLTDLFKNPTQHKGDATHPDDATAKSDPSP